jgi:hypothetical protein
VNSMRMVSEHSRSGCASLAPVDNNKIGELCAT